MGSMPMLLLKLLLPRRAIFLTSSDKTSGILRSELVRMFLIKLIKRVGRLLDFVIS
jgi:hypothetical protein